MSSNNLFVEKNFFDKHCELFNLKLELKKNCEEKYELFRKKYELGQRIYWLCQVTPEYINSSTQNKIDKLYEETDDIMKKIAIKKKEEEEMRDKIMYINIDCDNLLKENIKK